MSLYLQMDGIDDYIKLPSMTLSKIVVDMKVRRKTDFNRVIWDFRSGIGFSYLQQTTGGLDTWGSGAVKVDTVTKTNSTVAIPNDTRCIVEHTLTAGTDDGNIFNNNSNSANTFISGDIFDIKIYNGATLQAHYDMTTGTLLDQSGNGNNATLTGGTWLDDGTGGNPTGTDGSTKFDIRPSLYSDSFATSDTKQSLYADLFVQTDVRQAIYSDSATGYDTRLNLYQDSVALFDTLQEFFSDGIVGSTPFDLHLVLYADNAAVFDSKQAFYSDGSAKSDLAQQFYQAGANSADLTLVIYADASPKFDASQTLYSDAFLKSDTAQRYYTEGTLDFDTLQAILEDWAQYNEVIRIVLNISRNQTETLEVTQWMQSELKL